MAGFEVFMNGRFSGVHRGNKVIRFTPKKRAASVSEIRFGFALPIFGPRESVDSTSHNLPMADFTPSTTMRVWVASYYTAQQAAEDLAGGTLFPFLLASTPLSWVFPTTSVSGIVSDESFRPATH